MPSIALAEPVRLLNLHYAPTSDPIAVRNRSGHYLIVLPLQPGRMKLERGGQILHDGAVKPGFVRIVQPNEACFMSPGAEIESVMLQIPGAAFRSLARRYGFESDGERIPELPPVMQARQDVQRLLPLFGSTSDLREPHKSMLIAGLTTALLALILDHGARRRSEATGLEDQEFAAAVAFAEKRLGEHVDLRAWAQAVGLPAQEFARRFQQHMGVAPYAWFMDRKIERAKRRLVESDAPLVEIALDAGFCSQSHFSEAFRRRVGSSPGRWRRDHPAGMTGGPFA